MESEGNQQFEYDKYNRVDILVKTDKELEKGKQIGLEEGKKFAHLEIAKNLKIKGFTIAEIIEITQLTQEEVEKL